ncbi:MAG: SDR family NAD(P)-dependent oxidoreductase [Bacteroidota bacterium]
MDVLLTGAAGGIGKVTTELLVAQGFRVFAADIQHTVPAHVGEDQGRVIPLAMDVTRLDAVQSASDQVRRYTDGLDAIINNAGWFDQFPLAEGTHEQFEQIVSVNVLAAQRIFRTFFPLLHARKGRLINVSSEAALALMPLQAYGMSKRMLDAYTDVLRQELALLGMRAITIRPGAHLTPFIQRSIDVIDDLDETSIYAKPLRNVQQQASRILRNVNREPKEVGEVILRALISPHPKREYWVNVSLAFRVLRVLPASWREALFRSLLMKNG